MRDLLFGPTVMPQGDDPAMFNSTSKNLRIKLGSTATNASSTGNAAATAEQLPTITNLPFMAVSVLW